MGFKVIKAIKLRELILINKGTNSDVILFDTPGMEKSIKFPKNL